MNLTELRTFLCIVKYGSLVRASEQLNVTQSTVTARLKSLEDELGQTLITRQKSGAVLTAAGQKLRRYAETIDELWHQARQETALPEGVNAVYNIGCHPDLWPKLGKDLFETVRKAQPTSALSVWHGTQAELASWINTGLIDIALTYWSTAQGNQSVYPLIEDQLILVSTQANSSIRFDPNYVFVEAGEEFGRQHAAAYADAGTAKLSFGSAQLGLEHILQHDGSAYLPKRIALPYLEEGKLFHLKNAPEFSRKAYIVINKSIPLNPEWLPPIQ